MISSDFDWPQALRSHNRDEQTTTVGLLQKILMTGLRIALGSRNDVDETHLEDFAQEALLRIMDRLDQFQGRSLFTTWAQAIALNTAFAELRRKRWQDVSLDALISQGEQLSEAATMPDTILGHDEDRILLVATLRHTIEHDLTPKQRAGIMAELREMPFDQIADLLGTSRNATYKLLHDARCALKKRLLEAGVTVLDVQNAFSL